MRRTVIERLMCDLEVDLDQASAQFDRTRAAFAASLVQLGSLVRDGLVTVDGGRITISASCRPAVRLVCAAFDTHLTPEGRHAVAV